jgi:Flp pilus assembly protein TadD
MIALLLFAAASAVPAPAPSAPAVIVAPDTLLQDARQALGSGRLDQVRLMTARAISAGARGSSVDQLLADLAFAGGQYEEALARYESLLVARPADPLLLERSAISALKLGSVERAGPLAIRATEVAGASWRAWNARAVVADLQRDWPRADEAYGHALELAPEEADILNNYGWSLLLRGEWADSVQELAQAAALDPNSARIANNLELARAAIASELPRRRDHETDEAWAQRLNDAGVAADLMGDKRRAIAAFTQALEASGRWYSRAANNLQAASSQ